MKLYVSGPMAGYPEHNYPAFAAATAKLREAGYAVLSPAELGVVNGWEWEDYLRRDLIALLECDAVALLPGWQHSRGARLETDVADKLSMPVRMVDIWVRNVVKETV